MKEPYIPQMDVKYPEKLDDHMLPLKLERDLILDKDYPFLDKSFGFRFMRALMHLGIFLIVFPLSILRFGLKIEGRRNLYKHRNLLKNGAMTVSNHVQKWDFLFVLQAIRYRSIYFPAWKENLKGPDCDMIRLAGGIPIPEEISIIKYFNIAFDEIIKKKKWIHAFPESSMFYYFQPIRPFKKGVFSLAHRYNLPILPMAFSYRKPNLPFALLNLIRSAARKRKLPMITLRIGEPILFDPSLDRKAAVIKMRKDCHEEIVRLAGISGNKYPAEGD
ncbi:MAG: 1-acyl-sn-glycerol-3-phosphate acyltransferase [Treponema sp.]|nr:1-acyl-sn-glycerol-3-phosphate acyltransferase [Treponema sp.]